MLITIKSQSTQEEQQFATWSEVGRYVIGNDTPRSKATTIKAISKAGWEVVSITDEKTTTKTAFNVIDKLETLLKVVDKDQVKALEKQRDEISKNAKTSNDLKQLIKINDDISKLLNPSITLETMLDYVKQQYDNKYNTEKGEA